MNEESYSRPPVVAGMFYPEHEQELRQMVRSLIDSAKLKRRAGELVGVIVPHAGYQYSGLTAAHAFALLKKEKRKTVVLVGPSHREYFDGISVFPGASFKTPLGSVEVDANLRAKLLRMLPSVQNSLAGHRTEHALEVQLPFLQLMMDEVKILPLSIGNQKREYCEALGQALAKLSGSGDLLFIASSDLSHYYSSDVAKKLDAVAIESILRLEYARLMSDLESDRTEACGGGPIAAVLCAAKGAGADTCDILHACNSGDISGDTDRVVGYVSAALWKVH